MSDFIDRYHRLWDGDAGDAEEAIAGAESRIMVRLPPLLRDFYRRTSLRASQMMHVLEIDQLAVRGGHLVFAREQQGCHDWGLAIVDGIADPGRVMAELRGRWQDEGCSLDEFLRFFALANRPYEPPSCAVDIDQTRLVAPWRPHAVNWLSIQHELWTDGEAVFEEVTGRLGARDRDGLLRAAESLGVDLDELDDLDD